MSGDGPAGLIGACGPRGGERVRAFAARAGTRLLGCGTLTAAVPGERPVEAQAGTVSSWMLGDLHPAPGRCEPVVQRVARFAQVLDGGAGAAGVAGELRGHLLLLAHDSDSARTWILRDPIGARSLHHARSGGEILFAEHLIDLLALLRRTPAPDRAAVVMWIARLGLVPGRTLFEGIARLSAGEMLEISEHRARARPVWAPRFREPARLARPELAAAVADAALGAVARAVAPAEHPGVRLSGGLDSACVAAGLSAAAPGRGLALALTFPGYPTVDESPLIAESAAMAGLELVRLPYRETTLLEPMRAYSMRWGLPAPTPNLALPAPLLAVARERSVDRLLDGEGGDEMFGAWRALVADRLWRGELRDAWKLVSRLPRHGPVPGRRRRLELLLRLGVGGGLPPRTVRIADRIGVAREAAARGLVMSRDLPALLHDTAHDPWADLTGPRWWRAAVRGLVSRGDLLDASGTLARLAGGDVAARHPFMHDVTLIETMLAVDPGAAFQGVRDRGPLRDGLAGRIPETVRGRVTKSYFNEVSARRLDGPDGVALSRGLLAPDAPIRDFVRASGLQRIAAAPAGTGLERYRHAVWLFGLAAVDVWLRNLPNGG